jgi:ATP-binding cassette subfamily F protein 3
VVLVSHDRYFLDATVKRITQVGLKTLTDYHGNYSKYLVEHAAAMERLREAYRRQKEEIDRASAFINKFRYQATKARQVQSRIKQLDKVEVIEIPPERKKIHFHFPDAPKPGRVVIELKHLRRAYGDNVVIDGLDLLLERGERVALVGPNGAGKSTLMRTLAGVDRPDGGERVIGHNVVIDYFAQDQAAVLNPTRTVYEEMSSASPSTMVPMIRTILGGFLFSGDDVYKRVGVLSGGERNRLALAKMLLNPSNVLILDEPTNHLDLDSKEVLLEALEAYGGTLIFVSHDRYFVDKLATKVIEVGGGRTVVYPGEYEDFVYWKKQQDAGVAVPVAAARPRPSREAALDRPSVARPSAAHAPSAAPSAPAAAKPAAQARPNRRPDHVAATAPSGNGNGKGSYDPLAPRLRAPGPGDRQARDRELRKLKTRITDLEKKIAEKEQAVRDLEHLMASPGFYDDRPRADQAVALRQRLLDEVGALMGEWESAQTEVGS